MTTDEDRVRQLGRRVLTTYGLDPEHVVGMTIELNPYGQQVIIARLAITPAALDAMRDDV